MNRTLIDGTDRIDYAYEKNGGQVVLGHQWTSSPPLDTFSTPIRHQADPSLAINVCMRQIIETFVY